MAAKRKGTSRSRPPATTIEGREHQLIALERDFYVRQLWDGKASAQVITHYLKLGTTREQLEQVRLRRENELLSANVEALATAGRIEDLYRNALRAMRSYAGGPDDDDFAEDQILHGARSHR